MNLEDLTWFLSVAQTRSISAAAQALGISQPTLSKSIARLERSTRAKLLERQARGVRLTPFGEILRGHAQQLKITSEGMMAELRDLRLGKGGLLRWGIGAGVADDLVLGACKQLHAEGVALEISGGMTDSLMQDLLQGSLDLLLVGRTSEIRAPLRWQRIASDPMLLLAPTKHALASVRKPKLEQLALAEWLLSGPKTFSRQEFDECFVRAGLVPPKATVCSRASQRDLRLARELNLLLALPESLVRAPEVQQHFRVLAAPPEWRSQRELGFVWRSQGYAHPLIKRCIKLVQQAVKL